MGRKCGPCKGHLSEIRGLGDGVLGKVITLLDGGVVIHLQKDSEIQNAVRSGVLTPDSRVRIHGDDGEEGSGKASAFAVLQPFFTASNSEPGPEPKVGDTAPASDKSVDGPSPSVAPPAASISALADPTEEQSSVPVASPISAQTRPIEAYVASHRPVSKSKQTATGWGCGLMIFSVLLMMAGAATLGGWGFFIGLCLFIVGVFSSRNAPTVATSATPTSSKPRKGFFSNLVDAIFGVSS